MAWPWPSLNFYTIIFLKINNNETLYINTVNVLELNSLILDAVKHL